MLTVLTEIRFWSGILQDHSDFIRYSLSYTEQKTIEKASYFKGIFEEIYEQTEKLKDCDDKEAVDALILSCRNAVVSFITFKKLLLKKLLVCQLDSSLPPTFYNHMINEAMEFLKTLYAAKMELDLYNPLENVKLHKIWIVDASGHAATIACELDPSERKLIKKAKKFQKLFDELVLKIDEMEKMVVRVCIDFNAVKYLNEEAKALMKEFICYLEMVRDLRTECKIMGTFKPMVPDHMLREEHYYLAKVEGFEKAMKK